MFFPALIIWVLPLPSDQLLLEHPLPHEQGSPAGWNAGMLEDLLGFSDFLESPWFPCSPVTGFLLTCCDVVVLCNANTTGKSGRFQCRESSALSRAICPFRDTAFKRCVGTGHFKQNEAVCLVYYPVNLALMVCQSNSSSNQLKLNISFYSPSFAVYFSPALPQSSFNWSRKGKSSYQAS